MEGIGVMKIGIVPAGNGDLVMKLTSSAGNVDIAVTLVYRVLPDA